MKQTKKSEMDEMDYMLELSRDFLKPITPNKLHDTENWPILLMMALARASCIIFDSLQIIVGKKLDIYDYYTKIVLPAMRKTLEVEKKITASDTPLVSSLTGNC